MSEEHGPLHAPGRRLDRAFAALGGLPDDAYVACLQRGATLGEDPAHRPVAVTSRHPDLRWLAPDRHPLEWLDPGDHLAVHRAWLEACHGPDRVATAVVRTIAPLEPADGGPTAPAGTFALELIDLLGVPEVDAVLASLSPTAAVEPVPEPLAPPPRGAPSFRIRLATDGRIIGGTTGVARLLGRPLADLLGSPVLALLHPDDLERATGTWEDVLAAPDTSQTVRVRLLHADGSWRWFFDTVWNDLDDPRAPGITCEFHDIHEQVEDEQARHAAELGFRTLAESLPVGVAVLDQDGRAHFANRQLVRILTGSGLAGPASPSPTPAPSGTGFTVDWEELVSPALAAELADLIRPGDPSAPPASRQVAVPGPGGRTFHLLVQAVTIAEGRGRSTIVSVQDVTEEVRTREAHERQLARLARHDPLTGLGNRLSLMEHLDALRSAGDDDDPVAVLFIDLDHLKIVNDGLGHSAGDRLLVAVADALATACHGATVARFGGDEFVVVIAGADPEEAVRRADVLLTTVTSVAVPGVATRVTASIGVATATRGTLDPERAVRDADTAMYLAKRTGRARAARFDEALAERSRRRFHLEGELRRAIEERALSVHLQPVVSTRDGQTTGVEALCRWDLGSPADFIPIAEESGLIHALGSFVLDAALRDGAVLQQSHPDRHALRIGINASGLELDQRGFAERTLAAIASHGVPSEQVVLELTESVLIDATEEVTRSLRTLRDAGVQLALDDFGAGYSSLSYLRRFPLDILKLDISYTQALLRDRDTQIIVESLVEMAERLGLFVIAEGVETDEELQRCVDLGIPLVQGYLLGRPAPVGELIAGGLAAHPMLTPRR